MKCVKCGLETEDFLGEECMQCVKTTLRKHAKPINRLKQSITSTYNNTWNITEDEHSYYSSSTPMSYPYETKRERDAELKAHRYKTVLILFIVIGIPIILALLKN